MAMFGGSTPEGHRKGPNSETIRVCLTAPSVRTVGGQAVQAQRLLEHFTSLPSIEPYFIADAPVHRQLVARPSSLRRGAHFLRRVFLVRLRSDVGDSDRSIVWSTRGP